MDKYKLKMVSALIMATEDHELRKPRTDLSGLAANYTSRTIKAKRGEYETLLAEYPDFKRLLDDIINKTV